MDRHHARGTSRRWFLAGGAAALLGGGAGVAADFLHDAGPRPRPPAPAALRAAVAAERALIADLDATTGGAPEVRRIIAAARADHVAHLAALTDLLTRYRPAPHASASAPAPRGAPRTLAQLRAAEQRAAAAAAQHATALFGAQAAMLASIAASEASHAELLR
jgi:hypothetical protein